jgi:hypothetical protein
MKYVQPVGEADPNASYKDRNTGAGVPGSRVPAKAIENPQREIQEVILQAGLDPSSEDVTQLNAAIDQKIALATGGGENPLNDLLDLLRARLKIYPEILTADGRFNLPVPSTGNVRIPAGIQILHRGVGLITTAEQTFATAANKTYHMRYRFTGTPGWSLVDAFDSGYNPSALAEASSAFDTGYDDMISHRVVTDASNVATITALANKHHLSATGEEIQSNTSFQNDVVPSVMTAPDGAVVNLNWARKPIPALVGFTDVTVQSGTSAAEVNVVVQSLSRYRLKAIYQRTSSPQGGYVAWSATA